MLRRALLGATALAAASLAGCQWAGAPSLGSGSGDSAHVLATPPAAHDRPVPAPVHSAESAAAAIGYAVPTVTGLTTFTFRNDPQRLLGRPNGYVAAIVVFDERVTCATLGASCGAEIEQWPSAVAAQRRSAFEPLLVREYHYRYGAVLIRVSGALSPAAALEYDRALWQG